MSLSLHLVFTIRLRLRTLGVLNNLVPSSFLEFHCLFLTFMGYIPRFWLVSVCLLPSIEPFCSEPSPIRYSHGSFSHFWMVYPTRLSAFFMILAGFFIPVIFHAFSRVVIICEILFQWFSIV